MFGLFRAKKDDALVHHHVYMSEAAKYRQLIHTLQKTNSPSAPILLSYHFEQTRQLLLQLLDAAKLSFVEKDNLGSSSAIYFLSSKDVTELEENQLPKNIAITYVSEIYPLSEKDDDLILVLLANYKQSKVIFSLSLESPLMQAFGSGKIRGMMDSLGMKEDDMIEHSLITKSLENARYKLAQKIKIENQASSMEEWMRLNGNG